MKQHVKKPTKNPVRKANLSYTTQAKQRFGLHRSLWSQQLAMVKSDSALRRSTNKMFTRYCLLLLGIFRGLLLMVVNGTFAGLQPDP